jgi:hypothetical protein
VGVASDLSELVRDPLRFYIGCFIIQKPRFEGFEGSEGSGVMLGWVVLLMRMNEILLLFVSVDAWYKSLVRTWCSTFQCITFNVIFGFEKNIYYCCVRL